MANEQKKFIAKELVESTKSYFGNGLKKGKDGKVVYLRKVKNEDGSIDDIRTAVFVSLYIPGSEERNETSNFKNFAVTLAKAKTFKEAGVDLNGKLSSPIKIRFTISETYSEENGNSVLRELTNVAVRNGDSWDWIIKPKKEESTKTEVKEEPDVVEVDEDDLPF